jgi:hypothetical protein
MQAAHDPTDGTRLAVLREGGRVEARAPRHLGVEGAGEEAALVHVRGRLEQQGAVNAFDGGDPHQA